MGTVYLARDVRLGRRVALKFLHPDRFPSQDAGFHRRLLHEARAASELNHPGICQLYDVGGEGDDSWIAMELVDGESLESIVRTRGPRSADETIRIGRELAQALDHAHQHGVLHRDLKSSNIMCDRTGRVKILDFGIARRLPQDIAAEATRTETVASSPGIEGTLGYMAPEVVRGVAQDERSDLWALGVVLFEMLTAGLPFSGRNTFDLAAAIVDGSARPLPDTVPPALSQVLRRLMAKEPSDRYRSAAEAAAALDALSGTQRIVARQRRRFGVSHAIAALALLAVAAAAVWWVSRESPLRLGEQRLIAASAGPRRFPSFSPDGRMVAYVAPDPHGTQQIWVQPLDAGDALQITSGRNHASRPRWLPGTNRILFALSGQGLWTVAATGGTVARVVERGANPNVSRDGSRIVFEDQRLLWTAAADGSEVRKVNGVSPPTYGVPMMPALSPDGSAIAYFVAALGPNGDFWIVPAGGGTPRQLTSDLREGGWPVWTPDGRAIVVSSARAGSRTLWQLPADGSAPAALTTGAGEDDQPELTVDGGQLAYTNVRNSWEIRVRDLTSGQERSLIQRSLELLFPMFSPDGARLAYFGRSDYAVAIFTIDVDGSNRRQLTGGRELNHQPRWSHDGQAVYFFQNHPVVSLRRVPALGGPSVEFKPWNWETARELYFDPAGRSLVYLRSRAPGAPQTVIERTVVHDIATGVERVWPEPHTHPGAWSSDGALLVGMQHAAGGGTRVVVCRVADATCREVTSGTSPKWAPDGRQIYFLRQAPDGGSQRLWSVTVDGTDERLIADLGSFRPLDTFFDVSRAGLVAWAPLKAGQPELWIATIR